MDDNATDKLWAMIYEQTDSKTQQENENEEAAAKGEHLRWSDK